VGRVVERWSRFEIEIAPDGARSMTGPTVRFISPDGRTCERLAFVDVGGVRRVRFMPDAIGRWRIEAPGISDQFDCIETGADNPLARHGRLRVSRSGTHLEHADGTPFFLLSDTAWNGALLSNDEEWNRYAMLRREQRFTAVQFVAHAPWRTAPLDADGRVSFRNSGDDFEILPGAWLRIDRRIETLNRLGLFAMPVMVWSCLKDDPGQYLSESNLVELLRYQLARFGADHVIWIPFGDGDYRKNPDRWCRVGREVFGGDATRRCPVAIHPGGQQWPYESWDDHDWYDIVGYQGGHGVSENELRWETSGPPVRLSGRLGKPVVNLEPPYEGHRAYGTNRPLNDFEVRRASWWSVLLTPVSGLSYGAHGVWSWEKSRGEPLNHLGSGEASPWHEAAMLPAATQLRHLVSTLETANWTALRPDPDLLVHPPQNPADFVAVASVPGRSRVLVYTPTSRPLELRIDSARYDGHWVRAATGEVCPAKADIADETGDGAARFVPPSQGDCVLVLNRN